MGLFRRMKDPVRGTAQVVGSSQPPDSATHGNCKLMLVVQAPGMEPCSVEHHSLLTPVSKWPYAGATLPVTIDRANPDKVKIEWGDVSTGREDAGAQADAMVARLRAGGAGGDMAGLPPEAAGVVGQLQQMFPGATVQVQGGGQPSPEQIAKLETAMGRDLDGDGQVGASPPAPTPAAPGPDDRIAQLERLAELHESGALSAEEFQAEKRRVLGP